MIVYILGIIPEEVRGGVLCLQYITVVTAVHSRAYVPLLNLQFGSIGMLLDAFPDN